MYPFYKNDSQYEDIGLLRIDGRIDFNEYIQPICLSNANTKVSARFIVAGWGATEFRQDSHSHLQRVQLDFVPNAECNSSYSPRINSRSLRRGIVDATQICAVAKEGQPDTCSVN